MQWLLEHPTRDKWNPGAGGLCCHSIQMDPSGSRGAVLHRDLRSQRLAATTAASVEAENSDVAADFMPDNPFPEVGQCVHKLLVHPARPDRLWQQNHCGVYRSDDRGDKWERLEGNGLPSGFGFPLALDPEGAGQGIVIPEEGAENRVTPNGRLGVYRTRDPGCWELLTDRTHRSRPGAR